MSLKKDEYMPRLIDEKIEEYLELVGAISIEGPKWCGKTWTGLAHSESVTYMTEKTVRDLARIEPKSVFKSKRPQLIDEWQIVPEVWDEVRHECDTDNTKGKFILTGSTALMDTDNIFHSGTGRIVTISMEPMSLYESGDSTGDVSIRDMMSGNVRTKYIKEISLDELAYLIIRGGWPANLQTPKDKAGFLPNRYLYSVLNKDMNEGGNTKRNIKKMEMLIKSLARNESSMASISTIVKDIEEYESDNERLSSRNTISEYLDVLGKLYLIADQPAFSVNYRSSSRVGKKSKHHLIDPSLSCASLGLSAEKLLLDLNIFGLMFESMVVRDLRIYADYLNGSVYHFRENNSGQEVDAILEFNNGEYAAFEIKLGDNRIEEAIESLSAFRRNVEKKPAFMCVIVGHLNAVIWDKKRDVFIVPATSLRP